MEDDIEISKAEIKLLLKSIIRRSKLNVNDPDFIKWELDRLSNKNYLAKDGNIWQAIFSGNKKQEYLATIYKSDFAIFFSLYDTPARGNRIIFLAPIFYLPLVGKLQMVTRYLTKILAIANGKNEKERQEARDEVSLAIRTKQKDAVKDLATREFHL